MLGSSRGTARRRSPRGAQTARPCSAPGEPTSGGSAVASRRGVAVHGPLIAVSPQTTSARSRQRSLASTPRLVSSTLPGLPSGRRSPWPQYGPARAPTFLRRDRRCRAPGLAAPPAGTDPASRRHRPTNDETDHEAQVRQPSRDTGHCGERAPSQATTAALSKRGFPQACSQWHGIRGNALLDLRSIDRLLHTRLATSMVDFLHMIRDAGLSGVWSVGRCPVRCSCRVVPDSHRASRNARSVSGGW